ncbi:cytochrome P450 52A11 [Saccharata proteae CBS 121410]|uniref:Cytochrome P450 52A11 n=1 Tax=Saccharata proteae CBS 121410 TaxID=1314787 RepID=A0A9P4I0L1_9PEZI|nr:cytochrome P450 52A11 [Saccharata proteae CBS 121410]
MTYLLTACFAAVPLLCWYLYKTAVRSRYQPYAHIPALPVHLLWGHGAAIAEFYKKAGGDFHYIFYDMAKSIGLPPMMLLDLRPFYYPLCLICSHEVAEDISKASKLLPYSVPKSPTLKDIDPLIGKFSIISAQGEDWKALRKRYNPGFSPTHLITLLPRILEKTVLFIDRLNEFARIGEEFELERLCVDLTFDIIGAVVLDVDLGAQLSRVQQSSLVRSYRGLAETYYDATGRASVTFNPLTYYHRWRLSRASDVAIKAVIREKFNELRDSGAQPERDPKSKARSVLALSLADVDALTPQVLQVTADQIKSFLFAGHDTTSILLQWSIYELFRSPRVLATLRAELDGVFGPVGSIDQDPVVDILRSRGEEVIKRLSYLSAVIKEVLRLYPPGGTARRVPHGTNFYVHTAEGKDICLDGVVLYNCPFIIQRDPAVYGETKDDFVPERWLGIAGSSADVPDEETKHVNPGGEVGVPPSAWRPFERGPRNCIGQELANLEARVILAVAVRRFEFEKLGAGAVLRGQDGKTMIDSKGQLVVKEEMFNTRQVTSKPFDSMRMKVHLRDMASGT